jgi:hypothetical protein
MVPSHSINWNTSKVTKVQHTLVAVVQDVAGKLGDVFADSRHGQLVSAPVKSALPKASAGVVASVVLACAVSACSDGGSRSSSPPATETGRGPSAATAHIPRLPSVGAVIVRRDPQEGTVIRDRATDGRRFFLAGVQASECLSYLKANPTAAARDARAACPGDVVAAEGRQIFKPSTKP